MNKYSTHTQFPDIWISKIPAHWQAHKMKHLFSERSEKGYPNEPLLVASQNMGVVPKNVYGSRTVEAQKDLHLLKLVRVGDFVISLRSFQGGLEYAYYQGIISPAYTVLIPHEPMLGSYFRYLAKSKPFIGLLTLCVTGIREGQNIDYTKLKNHHLPVPPRSEQDQIVRFLDWKVSSINKLINIKKKEIKAIDALKRSIISHVITHGLMPDVPMKYSGVKWLGDIPAHWQTIKLKRVTKVRNEKGIYTPNSEDKYIGLENIKGYSNNISITSSEHDVSVQCICHSGDLMFSKLRPYLAKTVIVPYNCFCTGEMMVISAFNGDMRFLRYVMLHERFIDSVNSSTYGAKMPRANSSYILNMQVPIPQVDEQQKIADYIDEKVLQIDMATKKYEQIIDDLQVLKTRLISDVVTGKIDVRDIEVPKYEFVDEDTDTENEDDSEEETDEQED